MRFSLWFLCCVFVTAFAEEVQAVSGGYHETDTPTTFDHVTEPHLHLYHTFDSGAPRRPISEGKLLTSLDVTSPPSVNVYDVTDSPDTELDASNETVDKGNVPTLHAMDEARLYENPDISTVAYNVTETSLDEHVHDGNGAEVTDLDDIHHHVAAQNNTIQEPEVQMPNSTEVTETATSNYDDVADEFVGPYFRLNTDEGRDEYTAPVVHADLHDDEDTIDLQPPRNLVPVDPIEDHLQTTSQTTGTYSVVNVQDQQSDSNVSETLSNFKPTPGVPYVDAKQPESLTSEPLMATLKPRDVTPVMSHLDNRMLDESQDEDSPRTTEFIINATRSSYSAVQEDQDSDINGTATNSSKYQLSGLSSALATSAIGSQISSDVAYPNETDLDITGRAIQRQGEKMFSYAQSVCLAVPYPCGPRKSCRIVENKVQCTPHHGECLAEPYPCAEDESCRMINGTPACFPSLGICAAFPYPCNQTDVCRVVDNKVACYPNHCIGVTCSNHGICRELGYDYRCECNAGYEGRNCENIIPKEIAPCRPNPCHGDCECKESCMHELGYYCASTGGFTGKNCTVPVPKVTCGERSITVDITDDLYQEFDQGVGNTVFYVSPDSATSRTAECEAVKTRGGLRITIPIPFKCDSKKVRKTSGLVVGNRVIVDRRSSKFSVETPILDFQCFYHRQYKLVTSLKPVVTEPIRREGYGRFTPKVELCKISSCPQSCPLEYSVADGAIYTIGEIIYFSISALPTGTFEDYVTVISGMSISCDEEDGAAPTSITLLRDECQIDRSLYMTLSQGRVACASLQTPRSPCATFYIHLHVTLCHGSELVPCPSGEMLRCLSSSRQARSIHRIEKYVDAKIGPITIINGDIGVEEVELYPGASNATVKSNKKGDVTTPEKSRNMFPILVTAITSSLFLALSVSLLSIAYRKRMNRVDDVIATEGFKNQDATPPYTTGYFVPTASRG